jgi:hypothetical protein
MRKWIKLDPTKPFKIPRGYRIGRVKINGKCVERSSETLRTTNVEDDNRFIKNMQMRMLQRSIEWLRKKIFK